MLNYQDNVGAKLNYIANTTPRKETVLYNTTVFMLLIET